MTKKRPAASRKAISSEKHAKPIRGNHVTICDFEPRAKADKDARKDATISRHVTNAFGPSETIDTTPTDDVVITHLDIRVHIVAPFGRRTCWTLVTSGMSDRPMLAPRGFARYKYAELAITLPAWWKLDPRARSVTRWNWPIWWLRSVAQFAHDNDVWLAWTQATALFGLDMPRGINFIGTLIAFDPHLPRSFRSLTYGRSKIHFLTPIPLLPDELQLAYEHGPRSLVKHMSKLLADETVDAFDPKRPACWSSPD